MSSTLTNKYCKKCGTDNLMEEYYHDGYSHFCTNCGYSYEFYIDEHEEETNV